MCPVNVLNHSKAESDLTRRDELLNELRVLQRVWPDDALVGEALADTARLTRSTTPRPKPEFLPHIFWRFIRWR